MTEQISHFWSYFWLAIFVIGMTFLLTIWASPDNHKNTAPNRFPTKVEFCNNTHFILEDNYGNKVNGKVWVSSNGGERFEITNLTTLKIQKDIPYMLWIESKEFYIEPVIFKADCINEQDTKPFYIKVKAYKYAPGSIMLFDDMWGSKELNFQEYQFEDYIAHLRINYVSNHARWFIPFGGILVIEGPREIKEIQCFIYGDILARTPLTYSYVLESVKNNAMSFNLDSSFDSNSSDIRSLNCGIIVNKKHLKDINNSEIKVSFIPSNFFISKVSNIQKSIDRMYDEDFSYTGLGIINKSIKIKAPES